ncbi:hypothetical protein GOBAR_AA29529 [Gossypium barbadense]|uniref:RNase H type-1 domain-containing protein n=1 Tax=Gossypium barbadense TaxID=3634 RepID=A0A2P5WJA5_GOSBA|nr:hypothetical protein GOBAR_AA29529 [Gossypium barbadense]
MMASSMCPRCQTGAEMREHIFRECLPAKDTWKQLHMVWPLEDNSDLTVWLKNTFESRSMALYRMAVCALWVIWMSQNKFIHEGDQLSTTITKSRAQEEMSCLQALKLGLQLRLREVEVEGDSRESNKVTHYLAQARLKKRETTYLSNLVFSATAEAEAVAKDRTWTEAMSEDRGRRYERAEESVLEF